LLRSKNRFVLLLLCFLLFLLSGCAVAPHSISDNLPTLSVRSASSNTPAQRGSYSWKLGTQAEAGDSGAPTELVKGKDPMKVDPNAPLTLLFSKKPKSVKVNVLQNNNTVQTFIATKKVNAPTANGQFVYEVMATFRQGTVCYAFSVLVE